MSICIPLGIRRARQTPQYGVEERGEEEAQMSKFVLIIIRYRRLELLVA
jgi:hypothetical protein